MTDPYGDTEWPVDPGGATQPPDGALTDPEIPKAPPTGFEDSSGGVGTGVAGTPDSGSSGVDLGSAAVATAVAIGVAAAATAAPAVAGAAAAAAAAAYLIKQAEPPRMLEAEEDQTARDVRDGEVDEG